MILQNNTFFEGVIRDGIFDKPTALRIMGPSANALALLHHLLEIGVLSRQEGVRRWCDGFGVAWIDLESSFFQPPVVRLLPEEMARKYCVIPVYRMGGEAGGGPITLAMADPNNRSSQQQLEKQLNAPVSVVGALPEEILDAISLQYQSVDHLEGMNNRMAAALRITMTGEMDRKNLESFAGDQGIVQLVDTLLLLAAQEEASDIHIEPNETQTLVRFRIDGVLQPRVKLAREIHVPVLSRIKVMAGMDITERRKPQDGRLGLSLAQRTLNFRVSTVPAQDGEKVVLRILGRLRNKEAPDLSELFFSNQIYRHILQLIASPNGIFFITGPTGSGKSTTLFSAMKRINTPGVNIMTIEDPVEYRLPGINQVQVDAAAGLTFATALRSFLRQDPDVILVGEIRDLDTAKIAAEAALTGHLVLATMHTNGALQATTRLIDIGVAPFLVGPSLIGVLSQRLVRRICDKCKESYNPDRDLLDTLFDWDGQRQVLFYRGRGCDHCKGTGYRGRMGIHEMVMATEELRRLITKVAPDEQIREAANRSGFTSMRYDGLKKVLRGLTTLDEVERVAPWD